MAVFGGSGGGNVVAGVTPVEGSYLYGTAAGAWDGVEATGDYGTGADGAHTVVGTETATGIGNFTTFTCGVGTVYKPDGYQVWVNGVCTINGTMHDDGNDAVTTTPGAALPAQGVRVATGTGGTGRTTTGVGGNASAIGTNYTFADYNPIAGDGASVAGNAGGTGTQDGGLPAVVVTHTRARAESGTTTIINGTTVRVQRPAGAGGGGGCNTGTGTATSGAGGGAAGRVHLFCRILKGSGTIRSRGGHGANGTATGDGAAGGGGGGTGGLVEVFCDRHTGTVTASAAGGNAGTGVSESLAAEAGQAGYAYINARMS